MGYNQNYSAPCAMIEPMPYLTAARIFPVTNFVFAENKNGISQLKDVL
jgi:hypothetical protein